MYTLSNALLSLQVSERLSLQTLSATKAVLLVRIHDRHIRVDCGATQEKDGR